MVWVLWPWNSDYVCVRITVTCRCGDVDATGYTNTTRNVTPSTMPSDASTCGLGLSRACTKCIPSAYRVVMCVGLRYVCV